MNSIELFNQINDSKNDSNFFLLLDTAKNHLYIKRWLKTQSKVKINQIGNLFQGTIDETSPLEVSPLLIPIKTETSQNLQNRLMVQENLGMFSVLETSLTLQELIHHLQPFLQAEMPNGELALFRFYDPFITQVLGKMLGEKEYNDLLKPISNWWIQQMDNTFKKLVSD